MLKKILRVLSYVLVAVLSVSITLFAVTRGGITKLEQLETLIMDRFIGDADQTVMEDAAAEAMVDSLGDRWSYYIPASEYAAHQEQMENAYVGVGITITVQEDGSGLLIQAVQEGGPAREAGLLFGDVITAIDGRSAAGMTTTEAKNLVRGKAGTQVTFTISRDGEALTVPVTRQEIQTVVASGQMVEEYVGLVTIENFDSRCAEETIGAIEALLEQGAERLIFDVRDNPGGYASELVKVLDYLLPEGEVFRTVDYSGKEKVDYSDADCLELPMIVLVNGSSYSAAEFFAAALQEYGAAQVVGEQTCGKGYFQNTFRLTDGSAVGLSVGKYYTPQGRNLAGVGVTPDIEVTVDSETAAKIYSGTLEPGDDPQIRAALEALKAG